MPSDPSIVRFCSALVAGLGVPMRERYRLPDTGLRMLAIDELRNILGGRGERRRGVLKLLRFLGNEMRIPLLGIGTREAYPAVRSDPQRRGGRGGAAGRRTAARP